MIHHDPNIFPTSSIHISGSHLGIAAELLCHLLDGHFTHRIHSVGVLSKGRASRKRKWGWNLCKNCGTSWSNAHIYTCYTVILCLTMLFSIPSHTILYTCVYTVCQPLSTMPMQCINERTLYLVLGVVPQRAIHQGRGIQCHLGNSTTKDEYAMGNDMRYPTTRWIYIYIYICVWIWINS